MMGRIQSLAAHPRPQGTQKLSGLERYRIRQGGWRILYEIDDAQRLASIVKVGHRRDVYRLLDG